MAIAPKSKEAVKAKAQHPKLAPKPEKAKVAKPAKAEKAPKEPKAPKPPKEKKESPHTFARELVLERKFTDDEIYEKVKAKFPTGKFKKAYVGIKRWDINAALEKGEAKIEKFVYVGNKRVPVSEAPKPEKKPRASRKKVDAATDPLNIVAGLGLAPVKRAVKKTDASAAAA